MTFCIAARRVQKSTGIGKSGHRLASNAERLSLACDFKAVVCVLLAGLIAQGKSEEKSEGNKRRRLATTERDAGITGSRMTPQ